MTRTEPRRDGRVVVIGVQHHSPACARVVADTIAELQPTHVLIEGPADFNDRLPALVLGHELPIALFSHSRRGSRTRVTWTPFTDWSPEWVALRAATEIGAQAVFIDLPSWHPDFETEPNEYGRAVTSLLERLGIETVEALWDHIVESNVGQLTITELNVVLDDYFDTIRAPERTTSERERYMASWVRAARERPDRGAVVVVCGGFHRPAILAELTLNQPSGSGEWPAIPTADSALDVGSYLVPYSYDRLDVESPWWYERLWTDPTTAADAAAEAIISDLRSGGHRASTTDFIAFRTQLQGLAAVRGHGVPARVDVLDAAATTLVDEALPSRHSWHVSGGVDCAGHSVVSSCLATMRGDRRGSLHPETPVPGLVHHVEMLLDEYSLEPGPVIIDLADAGDRERSRILHQLRVLEVPGFERATGPDNGADVMSTEQWVITESPERVPVLIEAAAQGHTLVDAAGVKLDAALVQEARGVAGSDMLHVARILFDAVLCGLESATEQAAASAVGAVNVAGELADVGALLKSSLDLWRHDSLFGSRGSAMLAAVVDASSARAVALAARVRAGAGGADIPRIAALAAVSEAMVHVGSLLTDNTAGDLRAIALDLGAAVDIRGAALGVVWDQTTSEQAVAAVRSIGPDWLGDWLAGLFGVARERFLDTASSSAVLNVVDHVMTDCTEHDFLKALPALRQAFEFFPPRERATIARRLVVLPPAHESSLSVEAGRALDQRVDSVLHRIGLR